MADAKPDILAIFTESLARESDEERSRHLDEACQGDPQVRGRVEALLRAHSDAGNFLGGQSPAATPTIERPITEQPGTLIGRYKLLELIGEGGFGDVYLTEQTEPVRRKVALKIIKLGMDTKQVIARFETERQALAMMDHPNIAQVHDAGATDTGRPYFVMELVQGVPITEHCDKNNLTTKERLELFIDVCQAIQHAHLKGVIHRDIKPTNVMVTLLDGKPVPKMIDFGIAKATQKRLTEKTCYTDEGQFLGTPQYMSPEQAGMSDLDVDIRTDIYSLGVLLYELLTGAMPFEREKFSDASFDELRRIIREEEPPRPSIRLSTLDAALETVAERRATDARTLSQQLSGELDWIVMKALEKDRTRRYQTANSLAQDVQRHLDDKPVEACPPSKIYQFRKFARRHRVKLTITATLAAFLVIATVVSTYLAAWALHAEDIANTERVDALNARELAEGAEKLAREQEELAGQERELADEQRRLAEKQRREIEAMLVLALQDFNPVGAAFGPDGNFYVASWGTDRVLRFHGRTGRFIDQFVGAGAGGLNRPEGLVFGPDTNGDGTDDLYVASGKNHAVLRYDGATGAFLDEFIGPRTGLRHPTGLVFGPDGNLYVTSEQTHNVLRYDRTTGKFMGEFVPRRSGGMGHPKEPVFGPDGNLYVTAFGPDNLLRYDGTIGNFLGEFVPHGSGGLEDPEGLAFGPDGSLYVTSSETHNVLRYDGTTGKFMGEFVARGAGGLMAGQKLVFGPDGNLYVTSFLSDTVPRYDGVTGKFIDVFVKYDRRQLIGATSQNPAMLQAIAEAYTEVAHVRRIRGQHEKADAALRKATRAALAQTYRDSGDGYGTVGELDKAQAYFEKAIELGDSSYYTRYKHALLCLGVRDLAGYREACAAMLHQFSKSSNTAEPLYTAWTCVLAPDVLDDYSPAIELAESVIEVDPKLPFHQLCFGAALYRAGRFDKALETLESIAELEKAMDRLPAYSWFVLAMAHHRVGHHNEAQELFDKGVQWTERVMREHEDGTNRLSWNRRLTLKLFHEEAATVLERSETLTAEEEESTDSKNRTIDEK